jgi:hypothetical protein
MIGSKKNVNRTKWVRKLLLAASNNENEEVAARWLMQHLGYCYNDCFAEVACVSIQVNSGHSSSILKEI